MAETSVKPFFELRQFDVRRVQVIEERERQAEVLTELVEGNLGLARLREDVVAGDPDGRQIVGECAGPIEDDVANHGGSVAGQGGGKSGKSKVES